MNLLKSLAKAFRKSPHTTLNAPGSFKFIGQPTGDVEVLKKILRDALQHDHGLNRAYLSRIRHPDDAQPRLALCLDTESSPEAVIRPLSKHCAQYIASIDILFFADLAQHHIDQLKSVSDPFYKSADT